MLLRFRLVDFCLRETRLQLLSLQVFVVFFTIDMRFQCRNYWYVYVREWHGIKHFALQLRGVVLCTTGRHFGKMSSNIGPRSVNSEV